MPSNIRRIPLIALLIFAACSPIRGDWTSQELEAAAHFYKSQRANKEYLRIVRGGDFNRKFTYQESVELQKEMKKALNEALQVMADPSFLGKVHPDMREHYRNEYVRSLEMTLQNMDQPNPDIAELADNLYNSYVEWYVGHQKEFRIPKEN
ncbi:MAG: hypothetical protein HZA03_04000 [Nitrospinae bacterium]|nr:hypothetical protein [Nitrospinota bacterium]